MAETKEVSFPVTNTATLKLGRGLEASEDGSINVTLAVAGNTLAAPGIAIFSANQFTVNTSGMVQIKPATATTNGICSFDSAVFTVTSTGRVQAKSASMSNRGVVQLATVAEAQNGTDANKAITPATLKQRLASIEERIKNINLNGQVCATPNTLLNIKDTNAYPLNNIGEGAIIVWDAKNGCWAPSNILLEMLSLLKIMVKQSFGSGSPGMLNKINNYNL